MTAKREREIRRLKDERNRKKMVEQQASRQRRRRVNTVVGLLTALAVVAVVVVASVVGAGDQEPLVAEPTVTLTASPTEQPADASNPCPPGLPPVADPVQLDAAPAPDETGYDVTLVTTCGDIALRLDGAAAPQAVGSLVTLAQAGFFDASPCHRLTTSGIFVLQCGDPTATGTGGPGYRFGPIENAPADDVYPAGTLAMARVGGDGESMGSQFFLVYEDSTIPSDAAGGYTVMGQVTDGLDILRQVAEGGLAGDGVAPARSIGIVSVTVEETA